MSVLITEKFQGDTAMLRKAFADRTDELVKFADLARAGGCLHHRFGVGDGFAVVVDEWETLEQFQKFMENPDLQAFIAAMGADPAPPEVTVTEAVMTADEF
jgi:quinol monooxygenase YgiN